LFAAQTGDINNLTALYLSGTDLSAGDYDRKTPLHFAVLGNQLQVV